MDKNAHTNQGKTSKKLVRRSNSNEMVYCPQKVYSPHASPQMAPPHIQQQHQHSYQHQSSDSYGPGQHGHQQQHPQTGRSPKVAGYRIIRQIIPGPHSTQAEIERALARGSASSSASQHRTPGPAGGHHGKHGSQPTYVMNSHGGTAYETKPQKVYSPHNLYCNHRAPSIYRKHSTVDNGAMHRSSSIENF